MLPSFMCIEAHQTQAHMNSLSMAAASCLDLFGQVSLEAPIQDLALPWLEAVHHGWNGAQQISTREENQLLQMGSSIGTRYRGSFRAATK